MSHARKASFAMLAIVFLFAATASAHHGTANYDTGKNVDLKGTVVDFQFVNPHVIISIDVKGIDGKTTRYQGELTSPNRLTRLGWSKSSLKVGDTITMGGYPTKSGSPEIWIQKITLANGEELATGGGN